MTDPAILTVSLSGELHDFVKTHIGDDGSYEDFGDYVRDLIRRDKQRAEQEAFDHLKAELAIAFSAPESDYHPMTAAEIIARNRR